MNKWILTLYLAGLSGLCVNAKTWYISNEGSDGQAGSRILPFKTISHGAAMAQPGDTVFVLEGIYRERVSPPRGGVEGKPIV